MAVRPEAVRRKIQSGSLDPLYLLIGDDSAEKAALVTAIADSVDSELQAFNVERLYANEPKVTVRDLLEAARLLPMMTPRRVVIVMHADRWFRPRGGRPADEDAPDGAVEQDALREYILDPAPTTTVVFVADAIDQRTAAGRTLMQRGTVVVCGGIVDEASAKQWVRDRAAQAGAKIEPRAVELLVRRAGDNHAQLRADVERLLLYASGQALITAADAEAVAGGANPEGEWALANALERGDAAAALGELALRLEAGEPSLLMLGHLRWYVEAKVPSAGLAQALDALLRTDLALKGSAADQRIILERLIVELCDERLRPDRGARWRR